MVENSGKNENLWSVRHNPQQSRKTTRQIAKSTHYPPERSPLTYSTTHFPQHTDHLTSLQNILETPAMTPINNNKCKKQPRVKNHFKDSAFYSVHQERDRCFKNEKRCRPHATEHRNTGEVQKHHCSVLTASVYWSLMAFKSNHL